MQRLVCGTLLDRGCFLPHQPGRVTVAIGRVDAEGDLGHFVRAEEILTPNGKRVGAGRGFQRRCNEFGHTYGVDVLAYFAEPSAGHLLHEGSENVAMTVHPRATLVCEDIVNVDVSPADRRFRDVARDQSQARNAQPAPARSTSQSACKVVIGDHFGNALDVAFGFDAESSAIPWRRSWSPSWRGSSTRRLSGASVPVTPRHDAGANGAVVRRRSE